METEEAKILLRIDAAGNWAANNPTLGKGEVGIETQDAGPAKLKIGDGAASWNALPYLFDAGGVEEAIALLQLSLEEAIAAETAAREASNADILLAIAGETTARSGADAAETAAREAADAALQDAIDGEADARAAADAGIQASVGLLEGEIAAETTARGAADANLQQTINAVGSLVAAEAAARETETGELLRRVNAVSGRLDDETFDRQTADTSEAAARVSADSSLREAIDAETTARQIAEAALQDAIDDEAAARQVAEAVLYEAIDNDEADREAADDALREAIDDEADARAFADATLQAAIEAAQLATQTWLEAVPALTDLPDPETLDAGVNYLCRVIADPDQANNGVWQRIAGTNEWTYFSDNLDFVDETELADAIAAHNADGTAHADIRASAAGRVSKAIFGDTNNALVADMAVAPEDGSLAVIRKSLKNVGDGENLAIDVHVASSDGSLESQFSKTDDRNYTLDLSVASDAPAIEDAVAAEADARDGAIAAAIAGEVSDRDGAIEGAIAAEADARDGAIAAAIAGEVSDRDGAIAAAIDGVADDLAAEATARGKADEELREAIEAIELAPQSWLPAVTTKADLPDPETLDAGINYLCRVIADPTQANNGVWQRIAGTTEWTYFSDNLDFVDETELADAIAGEVSDRDGAIEEAIAAEVTARNGAIANAVAPLQSLDATGEAEAETMSVDNPDATVWYPEGEA